MGLGDKSLAAGFMNQTYGGASTMDEQEIIRMRSSSEDTSGLEDAYGRTGNMRVARTLAKYQNGGRMFQDGGKIIKGKDGDPYEYKEENGVYYARKQGDTSWNKSEGNAADTIKKRYFPAKSGAELEGQTPQVDPNSLQSRLGTGQTQEQLREETAERQRIEDAKKMSPDERSQMNRDIDNMEDDVYGRSQVPYSNDSLTGVQSTTTAQDSVDWKAPGKREIDPSMIKEKDDSSVDTSAAPGTVGAGSTGATDPGVSSADPTGRLTGYLPMGNAAPDSRTLEGKIFADTVTGEIPDIDNGPGWWAQNREGIGRGGSNVAAGLLNVAPHLGNIKRYNNMSGVPAANLAQTQLTKAPSMDAGRQAIIAQGQNAANRAEGSSASNQLAASIAAMGGTQSALSQYAGQEAQVVAQNDARNAQAVNATNARNVGILNQQSQQEQALDVYKMRGIAGEWGNVANKSLGFLGDMNRQKVDRERMDLTRQRYNVYDQLDRAALKQFEDTGVLPTGYRTPSAGSQG